MGDGHMDLSESPEAAARAWLHTAFGEPFLAESDGAHWLAPRRSDHDGEPALHVHLRRIDDGGGRVELWLFLGGGRIEQFTIRGEQDLVAIIPLATGLAQPLPAVAHCLITRP